MMIYQVNINVPSISREIIEHELELVRDVLAAIGGELVHADVHLDHQRLIAYVRAESELIVSDIFEASDFAIKTIS